MATVPSREQCSGSSPGNGTQDSVLHLVYLPFSAGCLQLPAQQQMGIFAPRDVWAPEPGMEVICLLPTSQPGQAPPSQAHPLAQCLQNVDDFFWGWGCELLGPANENTFSP